MGTEDRVCVNSIFKKRDCTNQAVVTASTGRQCAVTRQPRMIGGKLLSTLATAPGTAPIAGRPRSGLRSVWIHVPGAQLSGRQADTVRGS